MIGKLKITEGTNLYGPYKQATCGHYTDTYLCTPEGHWYHSDRAVSNLPRCQITDHDALTQLNAAWKEIESSS